MSHPTVAVAGNPNCGKSTVFNALTGSRQTTGNWPGVTVEGTWGEFEHAGTTVKLVDLPGLYSAEIDETSTDVAVARDYLLSGEADVVLDILDAANLERHLYLTTQLLELDIPVVVALNMMDVAEKEGEVVDIERLSAMLGCPVVPVVGHKGEGIEALKQALVERAGASATDQARVLYPESVEEALDALGEALSEHGVERPAGERWIPYAVLAGDQPQKLFVPPEIRRQAEEHREGLETAFAEEIDIILADAHYTFAHQVAQRCVSTRGRLSKTRSDRIDRVILHPWLATPIFLGVMYLMFSFTISLSAVFIDFFDLVTGALLVDGVGAALAAVGVPDWLRVLVADGLGGGIQVVATFVPVIGFLYLFLSFLEDSGYMARVAYIMDRFMRRLGLSGKAFVPLVVGFGCNVPAIMATRTLDNPRERIMTVMMAPFMSCGARLSVYALFVAAFFTDHGGLIVLLLYLIGIAVAIATAFMLRHTLLPGEAEPLLMELPAYRRPTVRGILTRSGFRLKAFVKDAGKLIVLMVLVINVLTSWGTDGSFDHQNSNESMLAAVGQTVTPVFAPMGIEEENWPATVGIITGLLAKEVVVGTLDAVYGRLDAETEAPGDPTDVDVLGGVAEAFATIPANLAALGDALLDPLGLGLVDEAGQGGAAAAAAQEVDSQLFGTLANQFGGAIPAFAYLLFVLLYFPCVAATGAIYRETSAGWATFAVGWSTGLAFIAATLFYQAATLPAHPASSLAWIVGLVGILAGFVLVLRRLGRRLGTQQDALHAG